MPWDELSEDHRSAAAILGYTKTSWDEIPMKVFDEDVVHVSVVVFSTEGAARRRARS